VKYEVGDKVKIKAFIDKQIPEKPNKCTYEPLIQHGWEYECPSCGKAIGFNRFAFDYTDEDPYCPSCGQKIDWEV
jgi:DNA-directed RNA polymerase subunit RPC12/RpoP